MQVWTYTLASVFAVSLISFLGIVFLFSKNFFKKASLFLVSFAVGALFGDAIHNLIDGMLIGASFLVSFPIGISTTVAIFLHEIPQEIGDFSVFLHGGLKPKKAIFFNFLSALTAFLGAVGSLIIGERLQGFGLFLLPVAAGGFLYIAGSDLLPEPHPAKKSSTSIIQLISIILGVGVMVLLLLL